jgi:hypothetical protein
LTPKNQLLIISFFGKAGFNDNEESIIIEKRRHHHGVQGADQPD